MHRITHSASAAWGADLQVRTGATCRWRASAHRSLECNTSPSPRLVSGKSQRTALVAGELNAVNAPSNRAVRRWIHLFHGTPSNPYTVTLLTLRCDRQSVGCVLTDSLPSLSDSVCPPSHPTWRCSRAAATQVWWWEPVGTSWCRWCKGCWRVQPHGKHHDLRRRRAVRRVDDVRRVSTALTRFMQQPRPDCQLLRNRLLRCDAYSWRLHVCANDITQ